MKSWLEAVGSLCDLQDKVLPTVAQPATPVNISWAVHQAGVSGNFGSFLRNNAGNPGNVHVTGFFIDTDIIVGDSLGAATIGGGATCTKIALSGTISFPVAGTYHMTLYGVHPDPLGGSPIVDDTAAFDVVVGGVTPPTGVAKAQVTVAVIPTAAVKGTYVDWSMTIKNVGDTGIFGGAILNYSGPGSVMIKWQGVETELPQSQTSAWIVSYSVAQPNGTTLVTSGQIKFLVDGTYTVQIHGVHKDTTGAWVSDDYKEFTVTVSIGVPPPTDKCSLSGTVTGLFGMVIANVKVSLDSTETTTDNAGKYTFTDITAGKYKLTVASLPFYYAGTVIDVDMSEAGKAYKQDIQISLTSMVMYGVPAAAVTVVTGIALLRRRSPQHYPQLPQLPYYQPPQVPQGYKLVRE